MPLQFKNSEGQVFLGCLGGINYCLFYIVFILRHADSDNAILGEFRPKSAGTRFKLLNQPHLIYFPTSL